MIEIEGLEKIVEQGVDLSIDSLVVQSGEIAAIVGPVGSSRDVLFDLLLGKSRPTTGTVRVSGINPPEDREAFSRLAGVLFAEDGLYGLQSSEKNLAFHARLHGLNNARVRETLAMVGLGDQAGIRVDRLSSGLARRLAFGRAILHRPAALILVEPFSRCDEATINLLTRLIRQQAEENAVAVLILADDNAHLLPLCDTVYLLNQGQINELDQSQPENRSAQPFRIPVRQEGVVALVNPVDILYADAVEGKAVLHTHEAHLLTQFTLSELEERLAPSGFFRAHRSYLVNLQHVTEVIPYTRNSFSLRLDDQEGTKIPLSKAAAAELRNLLGY